MSLMEFLTMLTVMIAALALLVSVVNVTFTITWTISRDRRDNDKKKK